MTEVVAMFSFFVYLLRLKKYNSSGADKTRNCSKLMNTFTEVCSQSGVPIADDKTEGPSTRKTYLGLLIAII
jgi:hypothetical protein